MKRDLDLIRGILLMLEDGADSGETAAVGWRGHLDDTFSKDQIQYHVQLANDAGLIVADELVPGQWWPERMTWDGHEFLDAARNESLWSEAKDRVGERLESAPFALVHSLLLDLAQERLAGAARPARTKPAAGKKASSKASKTKVKRLNAKAQGRKGAKKRKDLV